MPILSAIVLAALSSTPSLPPPSAQAVRITGFRQGLMQPDKDGVWGVYEAGDAFVYAVNGNCIALQQKEQCMWHGFEFNYEASAAPTILNCVTSNDPPLTIVNPTTKFGEAISVFNWTIELREGKGTFVNPQYDVIDEAESQTRTASTECSYADQVVLKFKFTVTPPPKKAKQRAT